MPADSTSRSPLGSIESQDGRRHLRFERRIAHPVARVWAALTEPGELVGWLADADVDLVQGGEVVLRWLNSDDEGNQTVMHARITALDPPRLLEIEGDPHGRLRWELEPDGDGTRLRFDVHVAAPDDQVLMALAGWHVHLEHLDAALDGHPVDWQKWDEEHRPRWGELHEAYAARNA